ncbi:MAG: ABC transporter permease [Bacteroidales bacterium]|nr:ABC transporter permease [Bacteroidales bacterium]
MHLPSFIARRYLFSKAHRNVINIISAVSAVAIGIGCMALIVILSVYNGFDKIVESAYNSYIPDYVIEPAKGKTIDVSKDNRIVTGLSGLSAAGEHVQSFYVLEETVYVQYDAVQSIAKIKGVDTSYFSLKRFEDNLVDGELAVSFGDVPRAVVEESLAASLMLRPQFSTPLEIYLPSRTEDISLMMPQSSLLSEEIRPAGIISMSSADDRGTIFIPQDIARSLMEYGEKECSRIEIFIDGEKTPSARSVKKSVINELRKSLGDDYTVKDRYQQNETIYKMMRAEKFAIYMILLFVVIIISVNILASLSMLIIEKKEDIETYKALGMTNGSVRKSFVLHGWLICMVGAVAGVALGLLLCWLQHRFHIVGLPGNFVVSYYPVVVKFSDVVLTLLSVAVIGLIMAYIPARSIRTNKKQ